MQARASAVARVARRQFSTARPALQQAADAGAAAGKTKYNVDGSNFEIAPSTIPWKNYKNEYFEKRGYKVAPKDWKEWSDLPAPYKYLGVKVNPDDVETKGPVWKFFSDWKTAVPASILLTLPLWMFNYLPPVDERFELAMITLGAGWVIVGAAGPVFRSFKRSRVATKVKALLQHEADLNATIASASDAFAAGAKVPEYIRMVNAGERALRAMEAEAATKRVAIAQRDALVEQLDYLVSVAQAGAADTEASVLKTARAAVESSLEKDAALQQKTIETALKSLKEGTVAEDLVTPLFSKAVSTARAEAASKPAAKPFSNPQQIEMFKKRFGYVEDAVSESTLKRAAGDASALAALTGRVGGKAPAVGDKYVLKAPISYLK